MRTVEVKVVNTKLLECLVELLLDEIGTVGCVPHFGSDEEFLALDNGGDDLFQGSSNLVLVLIDHSKIEVAISIADSNFDLDTW